MFSAWKLGDWSPARPRIVAAVLACAVLCWAAPSATAESRDECLQRTAGIAVVDIEYSFTTSAGQSDKVEGSGYIVKSDGHIITAAHVLRLPAVYGNSPVTASSISVRVGSMFATPITATLITKDDDLDVALIKIPALATPRPVVQPSGLPDDSGAWLLALGFPSGSDLTKAGPGKVTARNAVVGGKTTDWLQTDVPLNPGESGGPAFNSSGEVVGIAEAIRDTSGGTISYIIPIRLAQTLLPIIGLNSYVLSRCADDPEPIVRQFLQDAIGGKYDQNLMAPPLFQTVQLQTNGSWHYPDLDALGMVKSMAVIDRRDIPMGSWFTISVDHEKGRSLWIIGYDRVTGQIDSSSLQLKPVSANAQCQPAVVPIMQVSQIPTLDGNGNAVGQLSNVSANIVQGCDTNGKINYHLHLQYGYYNGSGTWRGQQNIILALKSANGADLQNISYPLDRSRCIFGGPEQRSGDTDLSSTIGSLTSQVTISVSRVSGTQTGC